MISHISQKRQQTLLKFIEDFSSLGEDFGRFIKKNHKSVAFTLSRRQSVVSKNSDSEKEEEEYRPDPAESRGKTLGSHPNQKLGRLNFAERIRKHHESFQLKEVDLD